MQGYAGYNIMDSAVTIKDGPNLDSFSRLRVSDPQILHNSQFTYDLAPILFEQITSGAGATVTHDTTNRCALMTFAATPTGGSAYMQTYEYMTYQPGRSQLIFVTFNMVAQVANVLKFAGYSDGINGVEFQNNGTVNQVIIYSGTSLGNETVTQTNWNLDRLDGTGPSGITFDISKTQILVIDIQALYTGRVRVGFDIGGKIVYIHEFLHANLSLYPYIQTANLPVRCGMTCTGTVTTTMNFVCSAVISEGGQQPLEAFGYTFETNTSRTVGVAGTQLMTLRPKTTFNGITNRMKLIFMDVDLLNLGTTNENIRWDVCIGQAITGGTWADVNTTYSGVEVNTGATLSGSPAIVVDSGWVTVGAGQKGETRTNLFSKYPITLDAAGANRTMGTITIKATALSGSPDVYAHINYLEIR